jgi:glutamate dehydrogenase (NAD(P)+)
MGEIADFVGPAVDVAAPDVNTNGKIMGWLMDAYASKTGILVPGVVTGKPVHLGGSQGRVKATGLGVFLTGCEVARRIGLPINHARVSVQGVGNVGCVAASLFAAAGSIIVAAQDESGTCVNTKGINMNRLATHVESKDGLASFQGGQQVDQESFWDVGCDILIPAAAVPGQLTALDAARPVWCWKGRTVRRTVRRTMFCMTKARSSSRTSFATLEG